MLDDQETKEPVITPPSSDADVQDEPLDECKDIGVMPNETTPSKEEAMPEVTDPLATEAEEEEKTFQSPDDTKMVQDEKFDEEQASEGEVKEKTFQSPGPATKKAHDEKFDEQQEEEVIKKDEGRARPECVVFSVGKLKVNGIGVLCSFGIAAATVCIFLIGGKVQHHHRQQQQQQKIQLQFYGDDKRIQQVVQQTSRLNQAMSSVMGGGASTRANISFGGFYDGF
ncbi:hypothetical protein PR202_ga27992 [Eleusine coracana subsp. coracana]|uniref:DUF6821 domain-containing protein n=1 Tax=Eleusine coracana subsp. coracana TaxID=191504 RepID=A0AAV5DI39_ELECO|nr:hypothetical protein PR202_ga27992 [Eleusine coracana subsp. coracana]